MAIIKPLMQKLWASAGSVVKPSDTKIENGWTAEVPPHQWENWIQNRQDQFLGHINERGIPEWDNVTEYLAGKSYVQGSDGLLYVSVAASGPSTVVQNPTTDASDTYWKVAFSDLSSFVNSKTVNGYQKLPNGIIIQWGGGSTVTGNADLITFPTTFPNNVFSIAVSEANAGAGWGAAPPYPTIYGTSSQAPSSFRISGVRVVAGSTTYEAGLAFKWIAVGY